MPTKPGGQRRLIFTGNVKTNLFNKYQPGQGVGGLNASVRRAKYRKASSPAMNMAQLEKDFKIRTEVLDKSRNEKFTEVVPQLAEWYENIKL